MIRISNKILSDIAGRVKLHYPKAECVGIYTQSPSKFPHVCVIEESNTTYTRSQSETGRERHAEISYTVNIYSDAEKQKKEECYSIAEIVDEYFQDVGFTRVSFDSVPNIDKSIYRIAMRYRAVVSVGKEENGEMRYYIYRK